jgi:gluconolactonase
MVAIPRLSAALALLALGGSTVACGSDEGSRNGTGSGGSTSTGGAGLGGAATGGGANTGGTTTGTGGAGTGGSGNDARAFACPTTYAGQTPTLPGSSVSALATAPATGDNRFLEGPVWDGSKLYVSQIRDWGAPAPSRVLQLEGTTLSEFLPDDRAGTNGLAVRSDGKLIGAAQRVNGLVLIDTATPAATPMTLVNEYDGKGFNSPNDLTLRSDGSIYFTDPTWQCSTSCPQGSTRAYWVSADGAVQAIETPHEQPNGIALSLDESTLYIGGNNDGVYAYPVNADGSVGTGVEYLTVEGTDGMTVDCAGNLYVTVHQAGRVDVFKPDGSPHGSIQLQSGAATNVAFGGADRTTLYITGGQNLYAVDLDIPGLPY